MASKHKLTDRSAVVVVVVVIVVVVVVVVIVTKKLHFYIRITVKRQSLVAYEVFNISLVRLNRKERVKNVIEYWQY